MLHPILAFREIILPAPLAAGGLSPSLPNSNAELKPALQDTPHPLSYPARRDTLPQGWKVWFVLERPVPLDLS